MKKFILKIHVRGFVLLAVDMEKKRMRRHIEKKSYKKFVKIVSDDYHECIELIVY